MKAGPHSECMFLPPGPESPGFWQLLRYCHSPLPFLEECFHRFGDAFTLRLPGYGQLVMLAAPQAVKSVFRGDSETLHSGETNDVLLDMVGPSSVFSLDGCPHARQRQILSRPLRGDRMRGYFEAIQLATIETLRAVPAGQLIPMQEPMRRISLRAILQAVLGLRPGPRLDAWENRIHRLLRIARNRYSLILAKLAPHRCLKHFSWLPYYRESREMNHEICSWIPKLRQGIGAEPGNSILAELLAATDENGVALTDDEMRDAVVSLLFAGHDTISVALSWALEQIVPREEVMARIMEELRRVTNGLPLQFDQLGQLEYLDACIREALRIRTIIPIVLRLTKKPFCAGGRTYPPGVVLCPCNHLVHRRPDLYPAPENFRPERFLERKYGAHEWFPFGGGNRTCLGMTFAMHEMKIVLGTILSQVQLTRLPSSYSRPVRRGISLAPSDGAQMIVTPLKQPATPSDVLGSSR